MNEPRDRTLDRRTNDRVEFNGQVSLDLSEARLEGPGQNISTRGIYFETDAPEVTVEVDGTPRRGRLVRVTSLDSGRIGVAVAFED